jgi:hypothetical protein
LVHGTKAERISGNPAPCLAHFLEGHARAVHGWAAPPPPGILRECLLEALLGSVESSGLDLALAQLEQEARLVDLAGESVLDHVLRFRGLALAHPQVGELQQHPCVPRVFTDPTDHTCRLATGDESGAVDLMLAMVEAGTEQAVDLGYADEAYFASLERVLASVVDALPSVPESARPTIVQRLRRMQRFGPPRHAMPPSRLECRMS